MKGRRILAFVAVFLFAGIVTAGAGEKFGVKVYDGAKYDASTSKAVSEAMSINAACYRTNDSVVKVAEFYKKQPGLKSLTESQQGAMFKKGNNIDITVQSPWMEMKSGKMSNDTLISIVLH